MSKEEGETWIVGLLLSFTIEIKMETLHVDSKVGSLAYISGVFFYQQTRRNQGFPVTASNLHTLLFTVWKELCVGVCVAHLTYTRSTKDLILRLFILFFVSFLFCFFIIKLFLVQNGLWTNISWYPNSVAVFLSMAGVGAEELLDQEDGKKKISPLKPRFKAWRLGE